MEKKDVLSGINLLKKYMIKYTMEYDVFLLKIRVHFSCFRVQKSP